MIIISFLPLLLLSVITYLILQTFVAGVLAFLLCLNCFLLVGYLLIDRSRAHPLFLNFRVAGWSRLRPLFHSMRPFEITYLTASLAVLLIPSYPSTVFASWNNIGLLHYVRLIGAILLTSFLPGYAVVKIVSTRMKFRRSVLDSIVPAFLLSLFLSTFLEWLLLSLHVDTSWHSVIPTTIWLVLLIASVVTEMRSGTHKIVPSELSLRLETEKVMLLSLILFYVVSGISLNFLDRLLLFDAPLHISGALSILRAHRPLEEDHFLQRISGLGLWYPSWFRVFLANLFTVSGFPPINAAHVFDLLVLKVVPIVAFYQMARALVGKINEKVPIVATSLFFLFSGFVWLSALKSTGGVLADLLNVAALRQQKPFLSFLDQLSSQNVFVAQYPIYTQLVHAVVPPPIGLTAMAFLLALTKKADFPNIWLGILAFVATTVGFLFHEIDIILMLLVFYPLLIVFAGRSFKSIVFIGATLSAFAFVLLVDRIGPASFFSFRSEFWLAIAVSILLLAWALGMKYVRRPLGWTLGFEAVRRFLSLGSAVAILGYTFSLAIWYRTPATAQSWVFVPWSFYPIAYGVAGLLALAELIHLIRLKKPIGPETKILIVSIVALAVIGKITRLLSFQVHEYRMLLYPFLGISFLAAFALVRMTSASSLWYKTPARKVIGVVLLACVLFSGTSGVLLALSYWSMNSGHLSYDVLQRELGGINYLRDRRPLNADVATANWLSRVAVIYSGAEHNWLTDFEPLFGERDPLALLNFLNYRGIGNLYLTPRDLDDLSALGYDEGFLLRHLVKYLRIAYRSSGVSVYDIPPLAPPSFAAPTGLVIPSSSYLLDAVSLAGLRYSAYLPMDTRQFESSTLIMDDFAELKIPVGNLGQWTRKVGTEVRQKRDSVSVSFFTQQTHRTQLWASFKLSPMMTTSRTHLCITFQGEALPERGNYYYFELQNAKLQRLYSSRLPAPRAGVRTECYPFPRGTNPSWITLALDTGEAGPINADLDIESIRFISQPLPWDPQFMDRDWGGYLSWVQRGGRIIVAGNAQGTIARFLSLRIIGIDRVDGVQTKSSHFSIPQMETLVTTSDDSEVLATANYTREGHPVAPLAFSEKVGRGEIVYLILYPYFSALEQAEGSPVGRLRFSILGDLLNALERGLSKRNPQPYADIYAFAADVTLSGNVKVVSDFPPLVRSRDLQVATLSFRSLDGSRGSGPDKEELTNVLIESIEHSQAMTSVLSFKKVRILPKGIGNYSLMSVSEPFDWALSSEKGIKMNIIKNGNRLALAPKGTITLQGVVSKSGDLLVYQPQFSAQDAARFEYATVFSDGPHGGLAWRSWMSVLGHVSFKADFAGTFLHMHDPVISGQVKAGRINEWWSIENYVQDVNFSQRSRGHISGVDYFWRFLQRR